MLRQSLTLTAATASLPQRVPSRSSRPLKKWTPAVWPQRGAQAHWEGRCWQFWQRAAGSSPLPSQGPQSASARFPVLRHEGQGTQSH